tara:strand:+ start:618 stop:806 length:189 start_codon:yes stop_codon:yes gene_type:complete
MNFLPERHCTRMGGIVVVIVAASYDKTKKAAKRRNREGCRSPLNNAPFRKKSGLAEPDGRFI